MQTVVGDARCETQRIEDLPIVVSIDAEAIQIRFKALGDWLCAPADDLSVHFAGGLGGSSLITKASDEGLRRRLEDLLQFTRVGHQFAPKCQRCRIGWIAHADICGAREEGGKARKNLCLK